MKKYLLAAVTIFYILPSLKAQIITNVKDINITGSAYPRDLTISNDKLFFIAQDATNYNSLWITLGTNATTINIGPFGGVSNSIQELQNYNNKIYFAYNDGVNGQEPWVSDGTIAGTVMLKDIYPGSTSSSPQNFTVANNKLFFLANNTNGSHRLYVSDGTNANTIVIKDNIVAGFNGERSLAVLNNEVFFSGDDGSGSGFGLWKSDGTIAGTTLVQAGDNVANLNGNSAVLNNKMYFNAYDITNGDELWVTDGTNAGTHIIKNISAAGSGEPGNFRVYHNKIYFSARDDTHGEELWSTDGTTAGTQMVKDVVLGTSSSQPRAITVYKDTLFFIAWATGGLWKTDGTDANTQLVKTSIPSTIFSAVWNNTLYMISGVDFSTYQTNGTTAGTITMKADNTTSAISHYSQFGSDNSFIEYHNELYLQASVSGITTGFELCKLTSGVLPLHLISFTGEAVGGKDILHWKTATELNTAFFIIEQSTDGIIFKATGQVKAAFNSSANKEYVFTQNSMLNSGDFYRLKTVDADNAYSYSPVILLKHRDAGVLKIIYKTGDKSIVINNETNGICTWQLYSTNGSLINRGNSSNTTINIILSNAITGSFVIVCKAKDLTQSLKFVAN